MYIFPLYAGQVAGSKNRLIIALRVTRPTVRRITRRLPRLIGLYLTVPKQAQIKPERNRSREREGGVQEPRVHRGEHREPGRGGGVDANERGGRGGDRGAFSFITPTGPRTTAFAR